MSKSKYCNSMFLCNLCAFNLKTKYFKCFSGFQQVTAYVFNNTGHIIVNSD